MADETKTGGGAAIEGDANVGGNMTGRDASYDQRTEQRQYDQRTDNRLYDQRRDQRQYEQRDDQRGGSVTLQMPPLQNPDSVALWQEIQKVGQKIYDVDFKLDDLPGRVGRLEVQIQPVPLPVTYIPTWLAILLIALGSIIVVAAAFVVGRGI